MTKPKDINPEEKKPPPGLFVDAVVYPLRGEGGMRLLAGAVTFTIVLGAGSFLLPPFGFFVWLGVWFYVFSYLWEVIGSSASGDDELPDWPGPSGWVEDVFLPGLCFVFAVGGCLAVPNIVYYFAEEYWWLSVFLAPVGIVYLPMALLGICLFNSIGGMSPHIVLPAIRRIPGPYALTCLGMAGVYAVATSLVAYAEQVPWIGGVLGQLVVLYLAMCQMRFIGQTYHRNAKRIGWFESEDD